MRNCLIRQSGDSGKATSPQSIFCMILPSEIQAIVEDNLVAVKALLEADREFATRRFETPALHRFKIFHWIYVGDIALHLAAAGHRAAIVQLLLTAGADPNSAHNHRRSTPLHYAADGFITGPAWDGKRQVETLRCLLKGGAEIEAQDLNCATALHRAVRTRCAEAVEFLLTAGSNPKAGNKSGSTPFHLAVQNTGRGGSGAPEAIRAQRQIIESFLTRGLSPDLENGPGKSVADCAGTEWVRQLLASAS